MLKKASSKDHILSKVIRYVNGFWPNALFKGLKPYYNWREEFSVENGCLFWQDWIVIPSKLQDKVLSELHQGHLGIVKMKNLARMLVLFPKRDNRIKNTAKRCVLRQSSQPIAAESPVHPWEFPKKPYIGFTLTLQGQNMDICG